MKFLGLTPVLLACAAVSAAYVAPAGAQATAGAGRDSQSPSTDATRSSAARASAGNAAATAPRAERAAAATAVRGRLTLSPGPRQDVIPGEVAQSVIYFLPKGGADAKATPAQFTVRTHSKGFEPSLLVAPAGSVVSFANRDTIMHNVFSVTAGSAFDLGTYPAGQTRSHRFQKPGLVVVNCNVHRGMRANVLVMDTPYYTRPQADGSFRLELPGGPGTLVMWHPRAAAQTVEVTGPINGAVVRTLLANRPRIAANL